MAAKSAAGSAPLDAPVIGGRYRVVERLGKGGMGTGYRVVDDSTGRTLALKKLGVEHKKPRDAAAAQLRFRREFHTMASLRHPRVVEVYDYGLDGGEPYYTMELLDGQDLQDLGAIGPREACALLRDVAAALAFLHPRRLPHRDPAPRHRRP